MKLFKRKIVWLSILSSIISIPTIILSNSLQTNNSNQTTIQNDVSNYNRSTKALDPSIANLYASEIKYNIDELVKTSGPGSDQTNLKAELKKLFPQAEIDALTIDDVYIDANSIAGSLYVSFGAFSGSEGNYIREKQYANNFTLTSKGITKIAKTEYVDHTNNYATVKQKLVTKDINYLKESGILPIISTAHSTISELNISEEQATNTISITRLVVEKAIGSNELKQFVFDGSSNPIRIQAIPQTVNSTQFNVCLDYLNDPAFASYTNADSFTQYINDQKTSIDTSKLLTVTNPASDPTATIIAIKQATKTNENKVQIVFTITNYIDEYGNLINGSKEITMSYTAFPVNKLMTTINFENALTTPGKDYAFSYSDIDIATIINADIAGAKNIVKNPVDGTNATVNILETNNRTGMIKTNISIDKYYDESGTIQNSNKTFNNVLFKVAKTVNQPTNAIRNDAPVAERVDQVDVMLDEEKYRWAKQYIKLVSTPVGVSESDFDVTNVEKLDAAPSMYASTSTQFDKTWFKATVSVANYFKNNDLLEYASNGTFYVYINAKARIPTTLLTSVQSSGIEADGNLKTQNVSVSDLVGSGANAEKKELVKRWIIDKNNSGNIFENYKNNMSASSIQDEIQYAEVPGDNRAVQVTITLNDAFLVDGTKGNATFTFKITNLSENKWTVQLKPITIDAQTLNKNNIFASAYAKEMSNNFVSLIDAELAKNDAANYFENLPSDNGSVQKNYVVDDISGEIIVTYVLKKFWVKGVLIDNNNDGMNPQAIIYQAKIYNFKKVSDTPFATMPKTIDVSGDKWNTSIDGGRKIDGYNYKDAIKNELNTFLTTGDGSTALPEEQLTASKEVVNKFTDGSTASFEVLSIANASFRALDNVTVTVKVVSDQLAEASGDQTWKNGYIFTFNNAKYANTDVNTSSYENLTLTLDAFKKINTKAEQLTKLNTTLNYVNEALYTGDAYAEPTGLTIDATGDNTTGKAVIKLTFNKFFIANKEVTNHVVAFNFTFKADAPTGDNNYLKDTVTNTDLGWGTNIVEIIGQINAGTIDINELISTTKKDAILNEGIAEKFPGIQLAVKNNATTNKPDVSYSPNGDYICINVEVTNGDHKVVEQVKVGPFTFNMAQTSPTASETFPSDVTFENINTKAEESSLWANDQFIKWNAGKIPTTNEDIAIIAGKLDDKKEINTTTPKKVAYVDFTFNGVYLKTNDIKSFVSNYVIKLKIEFDATGRSINDMEIVWSGSQDEYISATIANPKNNNWIIYTIISALIISLIAIYAAKTIYDKKIRKKRLLTNNL